MYPKDSLKLSSKEIIECNSRLEGWALIKNKKAIKKAFVFKNFADAFSWMISLSKHAEDLNHHPEWTNVYNKVDVLLSTHDVQGLTKKDFLLAEIMNELFLKYSIEKK